MWSVVLHCLNFIFVLHAFLVCSSFPLHCCVCAYHVWSIVLARSVSGSAKLGGRCDFSGTSTFWPQVAAFMISTLIEWALLLGPRNSPMSSPYHRLSLLHGRNLLHKAVDYVERLQSKCCPVFLSVRAYAVWQTVQQVSFLWPQSAFWLTCSVAITLPKKARNMHNETLCTVLAICVYVCSWFLFLVAL